MKIYQLAVITSVIGIVLILVSILLTYEILPTSFGKAWDRADAVAYEESALAFHNASFDKKLSEEDLQVSEEEYLENREKLDSMLNRQQTLPKYVRYCGIGFVVLGIVCYVIGKAQDPDQG